MSMGILTAFPALPASLELDPVARGAPWGSHPTAGHLAAARGAPFPCVPPSKPLPCPQNNSVSPSESLRASEKHRSSTDYSIDSKKRKAEEKDSMSRYVRDGDGDGLWGHLGAAFWGSKAGFG